MDALSWPEVKPELKGPYPKVSRAFRPYARAFKILRRQGLVEFMVDDSRPVKVVGSWESVSVLHCVNWSRQK